MEISSRFRRKPSWAAQKPCIRSTTRNSRATRPLQYLNATAVVAVSAFPASRTAAEFLAEKTPLLRREGWLRGKEKLRSHLSPRRRGGVDQQISLTSTTSAA